MSAGYLTGWAGPARELYDEALRVVPALALARTRGIVVDATALYAGYVDEAVARDIGPPEAWLIFSTAAIAWVLQLAATTAAAQDLDIDTVLATMVGYVAGGVSSG